MAVANYNKKKNMEVTNVNDSGTTQDKAQPVILSGSSIELANTVDISSDMGNFASGIVFNNDGTKMYVTDFGSADVTSYNLSTAYDVSTASVNTTLDVSSQDGSPAGLDFNDDGTKLYVVGDSNDNVYEYDLSTAYDISTATFNQSYNVGGDVGSPDGLRFGDSGSKMFIGDDNNGNLQSYTLSTPYDISTASPTNNVNSQGTNTTGVTFSSDGLTMYTTSRASGAYKYSLSTAFDISTATFEKDLSTSKDEDVFYINSVEKLYFGGDQDGSQVIEEYDVLKDSATGTGDIILDWTNISSESDIAVYDQNGNLLPYEIESFDATSETATLWCYNSWTRDDSVQAQVVYGDGPASSEEGTAADVWGNTGQNAAVVQHLQESSSPFLDSTSNNNDSNNVVGTTQVSGQFSDGRDFDGTDDKIEIPDSASLDITDPITMLVWINKDSDGSTDSNARILDKEEELVSEVYHFLQDDFSANNSGMRARFSIDGSNSGVTTSNAIPTDEWKQYVGQFDGSEIRIYNDGTLDNSNAVSGSLDTNNGPLGIGSVLSRPHFGGNIDEVRIYSDNKNSAWIQADYDASPKAGQVFFSQQAAEDTVQIPEDTATKANAVSSSETSTEIVTVIETANRANAVSTSLASNEISSATDTATKASGTTTTLTSIETFDTTDTATKASAVSTSQTSVEIEVEVDTAAKASAVSTSLTSNEALPITDTATKASAVSTTITSTEVINEVDFAVKAAAVSTSIQTVETSSATDTATKAAAVSTSRATEESIAVVETVDKADAVSTTITSTESIVLRAPDVTPPLKVIEDSMLKYIKEE